jgi:phage head maturation protease
MDKTDTQTFQHFKFTLPILKTRIAIVKDADGKDIEKKYVEGVASSTDIDLHGDRMDPSAIKTMAESLKYHVIRLNAEHDTSWQSELGDISKLDVSEDNRLLIEAELNDMSKAHDLYYALTDLNKKLGLSIGGYVKEYEMVKEEFKNEETGEMETKWVRHYKNIELDHIAVTSSPANPKTWVGAIAKSIQEDSQKLLAKKIDAEKADDKEELDEKSIENREIETKKDKKLRDVARSIVRAIQNMEADLLLELTYAGLHIMTESQVKLLDTLLIERSLPTMDKNV